MTPLALLADLALPACRDAERSLGEAPLPGLGDRLPATDRRRDVARLATLRESERGAGRVAWREGP